MSNERLYPPQTHPRQGNPPQRRAFPQPDQGYRTHGYNYLNAQPRQPQVVSNERLYPPQTHPRQGNPPQRRAFPQPDQGYRPHGYNYLNAQPRQPQVVNHRPQNTYNQTGGGQNNPQIQGVDVIHTGGDFIMGSRSGATNNFNNQGSYADTQIQGVNGGFIQM